MGDENSTSTEHFDNYDSSETERENENASSMEYFVNYDFTNQIYKDKNNFTKNVAKYRSGLVNLLTTLKTRTSKPPALL